ncbi:MAG: FAD-dependent monooxygenase [Pseudomonadota bacterium]
MIETDILIAGAGPAGLSAACALGAEGHRVLLVDPVPPVTTGDASDADLRTTALLQPARELLDRAGAWSGLAPHATDLQVMRIVDAARNVRVARDFRADDMGDLPFGWNVPNWLIRRELLARIETLDIVETRFGISVARLLAREAHARVTLSDGIRIQAQLVIACDGRDSPLRDMAGISARTVDYGQTAIVFAVTHDLPHDDVSIEVHRTGGPFTLVPLPPADGVHRSAVVWMDSATEQARRMALPEDDFEAEADERSAKVMGSLWLASRRAAWPIISRRADRMTGRRLALAAEAAHAMPPIGAQGLNTSLQDVAALRDLAAKAPLGSPAMLDAYARAREAEVTVRMAGIDMLNRVSIAGLGAAQGLRGVGIAALHDVAPLRRLAMRMGLGGGLSGPAVRS